SWSNETQIRRERSLEQDWVSRQVADSTSQIFQAHLSNVNPADLDKPRFDVIEPCDQSSQGALAGAVLPDNGNLFAGSNPKRRNMKCARLAFVAEFNGHEFQSPIMAGERNAHERLGNAWLQREDSLQLPDACKCSLRPRVKLCRPA